MRSEKQKMLAGELYRAGDAQLTAERRAATVWMDRFNAQGDRPHAETLALLRAGLGAAGDGAMVRAPFHCDYGYNIRLGRRVFLNFNCVVLDVAPVEIGDDTQIGPGVQILTADHPRDPRARREGAELGRAIVIGRNVWIGAGAIVLPGARIGDDAIVGAGAVVTRDVAAGATVAGVPARRVRTP